MVKMWRALGAMAMMPLLVQALEIENPYVRGLPPTQRNTAAFFTVHNTSDKVVELRAGSSDAAERLEIHSHQHHNGMMMMQEQASVSIAAGESVDFSPGGYHLMLIDLTRPVRDGGEVTFSLVADDGEEILVSAPVISVLKEAPSNDEHSGMHP